MDAASALALDAYWACITGISDDLAGLPWGVFRRTRAGREPAGDHAAAWLLGTQSNPEMTAFEFRQLMFQWALTHGNAVAEIERDGAGRPVWLWPVEPWRVSLDRFPDGGLGYRVTNPGRPDSVLDIGDVIHVKGMGSGLWGYSVLEAAARSLGIALLTDRHAGRVFANDGRPGVVIEFEKTLGKPVDGVDPVDRFRRGWDDRHKGNPNGVAIVEMGGKVRTIDQTSPQDAELLASRKFSGESVCRWFKYPQHKAGFLDRATFNNIEELNIDYVTSTLMPWAVRAEQQANLKLFGLKQRGEYYTKIGLNGLMRGNAVSRADFYARMVERGLMHPDEPRELEDLNPIPGGLGREHFVPVNWQTMARAVNPPAPPSAPEPPPPPDSNPPPQGGKEPAAGDALKPAFRDAAGRVLRREGHRAADALKRHAGDPAGLAAWRTGFLAEHRGYVAKAFAAVVGETAASPAVETALGLAAAGECEAFAARLAVPGGGPAGADLAAAWEIAHADALAGRVLTALTVATAMK